MKELTSKYITRILKQVRTKAEEDIVRDWIGDMRSSIYQHNGKRRNAANTGIPGVLGAALSEAAGELEIVGDRSEVKEFFINLQEALDRVPVLKLDLAFEPGGETVRKLRSWTDEKLGENTILDVRVDREILGGARIMFGGRYFEWTLKEEVAKILDREKTKILK